jgi:cleavage and polyadenylation specificity factor subunit 3
MGAVDVKQTGEQELTLEWDSSASNDMIADSTLALITGIDKSPASAKRTLSFDHPSLHGPFMTQLYSSHGQLSCSLTSTSAC